jgi:hypothetical protein
LLVDLTGARWNQLKRWFDELQRLRTAEQAIVRDCLNLAPRRLLPKAGGTHPLFRRTPWRSGVRLKDVFDWVAEYAGDRERQWKTGIVSPCLDRVDRLT